MFTHIKGPEINRPFVKQLDRDDGHFYLTECGHVYPSITTVLRINTEDGLKKAEAYLGKKELERRGKNSREVGTKMHKIIENYLANKGVPKFIKGDYEFDPLKLFNKMKPEIDKIDNIRALETPLYSDCLGLAGTVDCVAEFDGKLSIIDFKNSRRRKDKEHLRNYAMQLYAYKKMWKECVNIDIEQGVNIIGVWNGNNQVEKVKVDEWESKLWDTLVNYEAKPYIN